ncbi:MAG: ABC transporter substrate-binding protein [Suilimivivens sp.]
MKKEVLKKLLALTSAAALGVSLLAGCSGGSTEPAAATESSEASTESAGSSTEAEPAAADTGDTITIGTISPNTGTLAAYGESVVNAINLAVEEINANGGVLGKNLAVISYDDKGDSTEGANAFNKLVGEDVCAIIGSVTSGVTAGLAPLADESQIVILTPTATADTITESDNYVFRTCFKDSYQGKMAAKFAAEELGVTKVAILYASGDAYSAGLREAFTEAAAELGLEIVAEESSSSTDDTEFSSQLTNIAASGAEFLFAPYYYNAVGPYIVPQARAAGYEGVIMGADGFDGTVGTMVDDKTLYNNCYFTNHYSPDDTSEAVQTFVKAYTDKYGSESLNALGALAYDSVYMLADAIEKAGSTDRTAIRDAMSGMSFEGVTGSFVLDETGTPEKSVAIIEFKDGEAVWKTTLAN